MKRKQTVELVEPVDLSKLNGMSTDDAVMFFSELYAEFQDYLMMDGYEVRYRYKKNKLDIEVVRGESSAEFASRQERNKKARERYWAKK